MTLEIARERLHTQHLTGPPLDEMPAVGTILRTHILRPTWHFVLQAGHSLELVFA